MKLAYCGRRRLLLDPLPSLGTLFASNERSGASCFVDPRDCPGKVVFDLRVLDLSLYRYQHQFDRCRMETIDTLQNERFAIESFNWLEPFEPHPFWRGGWMQTVSIKAIRPTLSLRSHPGVAAFEVREEQRSPDKLRGYFFPSNDHRPTVLVFHGMGGHALSNYMLSIAERLIDAGYPTILWNNRGAGDSADHCTRCHHPGNTEDISLLIDYLQEERQDWCKQGLMAVAFSLGGNLLLKYLAEKADDSPFQAAVSISTPLDMETTSRNLRRGLNRIFDRYLLRKKREELLRECAELSSQERQAIRNANSVWEMDQTFTAPHLGYESVTDFYRDNSAIHVLGDIQTPTLLFHAFDDPVVDSNVFTDRDWQRDGPLYPALVASGGHTGFLSRDGRRWHERATVRFFDAMSERID